jgi:hypothetical protein
MFKKYKILALLTALLTGSIFSSGVSAGWEGDNDYKCKVDYNQLRLVSSKETNKYYTSKIAADNRKQACERSSANMLNKIYDWLEDSETHVIVDISKYMECKEKSGILWWEGYDSYKICDPVIVEEMVKSIVDEHPGQIGYTISVRDYLIRLDQASDPADSADPDYDFNVPTETLPDPKVGTCYLSYLGNCLIRERVAEDEVCYVSYLGHCIT